MESTRAKVIDWTRRYGGGVIIMLASLLILGLFANSFLESYQRRGRPIHGLSFVKGKGVSILLHIKNPTRKKRVYAFLWNGSNMKGELLDIHSYKEKNYEIEWVVEPSRSTLYYGKVGYEYVIKLKQAATFGVSFEEERGDKNRKTYEYRFQTSVSDKELSISTLERSWKYESRIAMLETQSDWFEVDISNVFNIEKIQSLSEPENQFTMFNVVFKKPVSRNRLQQIIERTLQKYQNTLNAKCKLLTIYREPRVYGENGTQSDKFQLRFEGLNRESISQYKKVFLEIQHDIEEYYKEKEPIFET